MTVNTHFHRKQNYLVLSCVKNPKGKRTKGMLLALLPDFMAHTSSQDVLTPSPWCIDPDVPAQVVVYVSMGDSLYLAGPTPRPCQDLPPYVGN